MKHLVLVGVKLPTQQSVKRLGEDRQRINKQERIGIPGVIEVTGMYTSTPCLTLVGHASKQEGLMDVAAN